MAQLRVLIAEDDFVSATLLGHLVRDAGHLVCGTVTEGGQVTDAVLRLEPDVVLMDVHLDDEVSGILATHSLAKFSSVPVIVISATDSKDELHDIAESGALGFMKKPVSADELKVCLRLAARHTQAMQKVRESETLHRTLFENASVGIYICHKDGYLLNSNMAFARMLGYSGPGEILHLVRSVDEQLYADEGRRGELLAELSAKGEVRDAESRVCGRDGDLIWVSEHLVARGGMDHYESVVIDINGRKRAEAERNLTLSMLRDTVDAIADLVAVTDLQGNVIFSNKAFMENTAGLVGGGVETSDGFLCLDGAGLFTRFLRHVEEERSSAREVRGPVRLSGASLPMDATISPFREPDGEVGGAVFVLRPSG